MVNGNFAAYQQYGCIDGQKGLGVRTTTRKRMNITAVCLALFLPWIIFTVMYSLFSFDLHYKSPALCYMLAAFGLALVVLFGIKGFVALRARLDGDATGNADPAWMLFIFLTGLMAWASAVVLGDYNFWHNMQPYYDVKNLNTYPSVDTSRMRGQQLMDAGRLQFVAGTHLDISKSMGFKNLDTYCVAPIATGDAPLTSYDFWAVGLNCCSGQAADFHCGEFNNPRASAGLRLMRDDQRAFFRLAVQQAESAFNIRSVHPLFFHWMQDPDAEMDAYQDDGYKYFLLGMFTHFAMQLFLVVLALMAFSKVA
jgi:hypothetical protein